jgi:hypothetical protein
VGGVGVFFFAPTNREDAANSTKFNRPYDEKAARERKRERKIMVDRVETEMWSMSTDITTITTIWFHPTAKKLLRRNFIYENSYLRILDRFFQNPRRNLDLYDTNKSKEHFLIKFRSTNLFVEEECERFGEYKIGKRTA